MLRGISASPWTFKAMASTGIKLDAETVERIARRVVEAARTARAPAARAG